MLDILKCLLLELNLFIMSSNFFCLFYPLNLLSVSSKYLKLLYGIPILAQNQGLIGEDNVRPIVVFVITVKSFRTISSNSQLFCPLKYFLKCPQNVQFAVRFPYKYPYSGSPKISDYTNFQTSFDFKRETRFIQHFFRSYFNNNNKM